MVTIVTQPKCGKCKRLKSRLDSLGLLYEEVNLRDSDIAIEIARFNNLKTTPFLIKDGKLVAETRDIPDTDAGLSCIFDS